MNCVNEKINVKKQSSVFLKMNKRPVLHKQTNEILNKQMKEQDNICTNLCKWIISE